MKKKKGDEKDRRKEKAVYRQLEVKGRKLE